MRGRSIKARAGMGALACLFGLTLLVAACGSSKSTAPASKGTQSPSASATVSATATDFVPSTPAAAPQGWKRQTEADLGFSFDYPADWTAGKLGVQSALISADKHANIIWASASGPVGGTLDDYKAVDIASFGQDPDTQGPISIGGHAGWGVEFNSLNASGTNYFVIDYFTVWAGHSYDLILMSKPGTEDADRQLFQQIDSTLTFAS